MPKAKKRISLGDEVAVLRRTLQGVRMLAMDAWQQDERYQREVTEVVAATLVLVECRLVDLGRVFRGELDAKALLGPHNDVTRSPDNGDDLVLESKG